MKRFSIRFFMAFVVVLVAFSLSGAAQTEDSAKKVIIFDGHVSLQAEAAASEESEDADTEESELSTITPMSPAPGLSSLSIYEICSKATSTSTLSCELSPANTSTNTYPASLYKIYVVVWMKGYGSGPVARLGGSGGSILSSSVLTEKDYLCGASYLATCKTGQTVTAFMYWYDLTSALSAGGSRLFYAQSTGINNPNTTKYAEVFLLK